jgi:hypothetical protein
LLYKVGLEIGVSAQRLCVLAGERRALLTAVAREEGRTRHSSLAERLR